MLSQTAEYALRAMVALGQDRQALTAGQIAKRTQVPLPYLSKVLNLLVRAALITAQRGRGGGFLPARAPAEISILQVVDAVDPLKRIYTCPLGLAAHGSDLCPLHRKLDDAVRATEEAFDTTTLASMCAGAAPGEGSCRAIA